MKSSVKTSDSQGKNAVTRPLASAKARSARSGRERVLVEFSTPLLKRADEEAARMETSRSGLIRIAVEQLLEDVERTRFEAELAAGYLANASMNVQIAEEFVEVDREGF